VVDQTREEIAMKSILSLTVCALSLLAFASTAQSKSAQANGTFDFSLEGATGAIVFDANGDDGGVHGQMSLTATLEIGDPEGDGSTALTNVTVEAQFDCLLVNDNQAAMSGVVTSSSDPGYVGQQVLLAVVDKVEDIQPPTDAFAWGVYKPKFVNLTAADYDFCPNYTPPTPEELGMCGEGEEQFPCPVPPPPTGCINGSGPGDTGATLTWITADAELYPCPLPTEENPSPSCPVDPSGFTAGISATPTLTACDSFPLSAYPLNLIPRGHGNKVQVKNHP
jgi:hypothetical protein